MTDITLSIDEIKQITSYKRPGDQLVELHRRGFYRARIGKVTGQVILERAHYHAICAGAGQPSNDSGRSRPTLRAVK